MILLAFARAYKITDINISNSNLTTCPEYIIYQFSIYFNASAITNLKIMNTFYGYKFTLIIYKSL